MIKVKNIVQICNSLYCVTIFETYPLFSTEKNIYRKFYESLFHRKKKATYYVLKVNKIKFETSKIYILPKFHK